MKLLFALSILFIISGQTIAQNPVAHKINEIKIASFDEVKNVPKNKVILIDVRQPEELKATGVIPGSINIPLAELENALKSNPNEFKETYGTLKPDFNAEIIFTCRSGRRSANAYQIAEQLGYNNLKNFDGGWLLWESKLLS